MTRTPVSSSSLILITGIVKKPRIASAFGLAHAAEVPDAPDSWQDLSDADAKVWKNDVLHASSTIKQIKNKSCILPKGKSLSKLGNPTKVRVVRK